MELYIGIATLIVAVLTAPDGKGILVTATYGHTW